LLRATQFGPLHSDSIGVERGQHIQVPTSTFEEAVNTALSSEQKVTVSILVVSIDYFDAVIASYDIAVGQQVMSTTAQRIADALRTTDVITQSGYNSHAVLWAPNRPAPDAAEVADRITSQFNEPVMTTAGEIPITVTIGIASTTTPARSTIDAEALQHQAQSAALSGQRKGRAQLAVFDQTIQEQALESHETERKLRTALRDNHLDVAYQPIVSLHSGKVVGTEALARWNDDMLGSISPGVFIPIAEESGLIGELGRVVLEQAIQQASEWNRREHLSPLLTVNVSNRQLLDPQLIPAIKALLAMYQLDPRRLCLEITESVVMSDVAASMTILGHMKDLGLCLAIDDFGTGYSSLSYLRQLPVDILKIDKSFVQSIYNRDDRVITKAIIDLAHTLGMTTVAEGVETRLQVEVLHALSCDMAQGFYLHSPTSADQVDFSTINFEANESRDLLSAPAATRSTYVQL